MKSLTWPVVLMVELRQQLQGPTASADSAHDPGDGDTLRPTVLPSGFQRDQRMDGGESVEMISSSSHDVGYVRRSHVGFQVLLRVSFLDGDKRARIRLRREQVVGDAAVISSARHERLQSLFND